MIRFAIVLLLLANAGYYAFSQGMLRSLGWAPDNLRARAGAATGQARCAAHSERAGGERSQRGQGHATAAGAQCHRRGRFAARACPAAEQPAETPAKAATEPDKLAAKPADKPQDKPADKPEKPEKKECLVAGSFDAKQVDALRLQLAKLPEGSWRLDSSTSAGRWMVYVGKFSSQEALDTRRDELRALDVSTDRARVASLEPGISLGRFSSEEAAERHLAAIGKKAWAVPRWWSSGPRPSATACGCPSSMPLPKSACKAGM